MFKRKTALLTILLIQVSVFSSVTAEEKAYSNRFRVKAIHSYLEKLARHRPFFEKAAPLLRSFSALNPEKQTHAAEYQKKYKEFLQKKLKSIPQNLTIAGDEHAPGLFLTVIELNLTQQIAKASSADKKSVVFENSRRRFLQVLENFEMPEMVIRLQYNNEKESLRLLEFFRAKLVGLVIMGIPVDQNNEQISISFKTGSLMSDKTMVFDSFAKTGLVTTLNDPYTERLFQVLKKTGFELTIQREGQSLYFITGSEKPGQSEIRSMITRSEKGYTDNLISGAWDIASLKKEASELYDYTHSENALPVLNRVAVQNKDDLVNTIENLRYSLSHTGNRGRFYLKWQKNIAYFSEETVHSRGIDVRRDPVKRFVSSQTPLVQLNGLSGIDTVLEQGLIAQLPLRRVSTETGLINRQIYGRTFRPPYAFLLEQPAGNTEHLSPVYIGRARSSTEAASYFNALLRDLSERLQLEQTLALQKVDYRLDCESYRINPESLQPLIRSAGLEMSRTFEPNLCYKDGFVILSTAPEITSIMVSRSEQPLKDILNVKNRDGRLVHYQKGRMSAFSSLFDSIATLIRASDNNGQYNELTAGMLHNTGQIFTLFSDYRLQVNETDTARVTEFVIELPDAKNP